MTRALEIDTGIMVSEERAAQILGWDRRTLVDDRKTARPTIPYYRHDGDMYAYRLCDLLAVVIDRATIGLEEIR